MIFPKKIILTFFSILYIFLPFCLSAKGEQKPEGGGNRVFANEELLNPVFEKLYNLEMTKKGKINIVHIGDSHIQADFFTNTIRSELQSVFGDGGYGFTFPYSLIRTNGTRAVRYSSNAVWQNIKNISPIADVGVGLSGIALYTSADNFILQLYTEADYEFNKVKIIYPEKDLHYKMSITADPLEVTGGSPSATVSVGIKYHKVKSGESLSTIGRKYGVTITQIKKANGMKSNTIRIGQSLKIPVKGTAKTTTPAIRASNIEGKELQYVNLVSKPYYASYSCDSAIRRVTLIPDGQMAMYTLNGFVIENDKPGVIYHTIGVNGARMSDYNKYQLFFDQLPILRPDLVILSFGTNESFGKMSDTEYIFQLNEFVSKIKKQNAKATILVMTPPPSMFRHRLPNTFIADYSIALMGINYLPVWDLYSRMNGDSAIRPSGDYASMIAQDKVHYTSGGYEAQGELFASDFIEAYNNYKKQRKH
ncbi:MAG: LysM peptidoglycan-binding domain-containing protein [Prevotella sp.]|jgi:LysM repeat protein/lysophospholipase L1-like esterase|nr:LysM peptidoglycan-binding domain-containing protein [Prevotella sp.]